MPYFKWYGITREGDVQRGEIFSRDEHAVSCVLWHERAISVLVCKQCAYTIAHHTSVVEQAALFQQLGNLLYAGVRVREALYIVGDMISHVYVRCIIEDCARAITDGMLLSEILQVHTELFTPFAWCMIRAGEQSGNLAQACCDLAQYYRVIANFRAIVRTALLIPAITITLAVLLIIGIMYGVVPQFARIVVATKTVLPRRTELLFAVSAWVRTPYGMSIIVLVCVIILCSLMWVVRRGRKLAISLLIAVPVVRPMIQDFLLARYFAALGCLLRGGVSLVRALELAVQDIPCARVRIALEAVVHDVGEGIALSDAYMHRLPYISSVACAVVRVGESTGSLAKMISLCAEQYQTRVEYILHMLGRCVQPAVLVLLGLGIGFIAIALYEPILMLGTSMTQLM